MGKQATGSGWPNALRDIRLTTTADRDACTMVGRVCDRCRQVFAAPRRDGRRLCPYCAAKRAEEAQSSMAAKRGPIYEKAVRKQLAYWTAEAERLGL